MSEKRGTEPNSSAAREQQPASSSGIKEALGALTRALSTAGAEVRREVAAELSAAAREVKNDLTAAKDEVVVDVASAKREVQDDLLAAAAELANEAGVARARRDARSAKAERTRAELLAGARKVFAEHGYEGASVADLAKAAGYTKGALYAHFASKEDLFVAVVREVAEQERAQTPDDLDEHPMPSAADISQVQLGLETYLFVHRHPERRDEIADALRDSFDELANRVHQMRTGGDGAAELMDRRLAFGLSALHSYAAIISPLVPDLDTDAAVTWLEERLAGDIGA